MDDVRPISVRGITKTFEGVPALDDVSLEVDAGEIVALLGPSGCGKTTLLRTIAGLERPDRGEIAIGGTTMVGGGTSVAPEKRHVGMVFQDWALFPHLSVADNVGYGLPRRERGGERVDEVLELVGLPGFRDRSPATLSGGQQQRVALARALAPRPAVLLLDEPFSNLDTGLRVVVRSEVYRLLVELGITTVFVTHDQDEAFVLGDRIAVMNTGRVVQIDRPQQLYQRPVDAWTASFVGSVNLVAGEADGTTARTVLGDIPLAETRHGAVEVVIRPEDLSIQPGPDGDVELIEYYGHDTKILVRVASMAVWVRTGPAHGHERGDRVALRYCGRPTTSFAA